MRASAARHAECCAFLSFHETPEFCGPLYGNVTMQNSSHVGVRRQIKPGDHAACRNSCEAAVIGGELNSNTTLRGMRNTDTWPMVKAPLSAHNHDDAVLSRFARMAPKTVCMWSAEEDMVFPAGQPGYVPGFMTGNTDPCLSWAGSCCSLPRCFISAPRHLSAEQKYRLGRDVSFRFGCAACS